MSERQMQIAIAVLAVLWFVTFLFTRPGTSLRKAVKRTLVEAVYYALRLLPRDKNLVLFTAEEGNGFSGNPKYLFFQAQKYKDLRCVWVTKNPAVLKTVQALGYEACMLQSLQGRRLQLRAGTLIHTNSLKEEFDYILASGAVSVNTWHGVGLKRVWYRNPNAFSGKWMAAPPSLQRSYNLRWAGLNAARENYLISTSEEVSAYYPATYNVPADHVLELGQARNDVFFDDSLEEGQLPEPFKKGKVILYMPTYRAYNVRQNGPESVGSSIDYEKLSAMLRKYGYTFVVKQHRFNTGGKDRTKKYDNIVDISALNYEVDPQMLLKYTDVLVTDYSSCYTDFLLLDRPVVFYCYDLEYYLSRWEFNFDYDYVTPGPRAFYSDQLIAELEKLLQGQDEYESERQRVKRVFYSPENQGPVAEKQMDYIVKNIIER